MTARILLGIAAAIVVTTVSTAASAQSKCASTWQKAHTQIDKFVPVVGKLVCAAMNTEDATAAKECIAQVEKFSAEAKKMKAEWNLGQSSWTIGPRALPLDSVQSGAVSTEREFIGVPFIGGKYTIEIERTGGKAKHELNVEVCFYDPVLGADVEYVAVEITKDKPKRTIEVTAAPGTFPLIHLNNAKWGTNAHKYTIRASASGDAPAVAQAKKTLKRRP